MKQYLFTIALLLLFTACKPTSSAIITSKDEALRKGIYSQPILVKNNTIKNKKSPKQYANKQVVAFQNPKKIVGLNDQNASDIIIEDSDSNYLVDQLINTASDNLGVGYRGGGTTKDGFDCSGLMYSTFKKFDITLPRSSYQMAEVGTPVNLDNAKKGDLIFFINRGQHRINHVGMIVEVKGDDVKFIHSSTQSGVIISSLKESYYDRTFKQINRIIQ
ncbi:C40 family peptidase [Flavobacterium wongokense]|uniref:C40 family peptidase n=1 Tax=Flavobacterium wongokense TaxID=2910674 RepID=UPI001F334CEB|nr:C40 family peptidase [Flavobacterium sp. WG47]MCF6131000.1 C40 family peptidase [Flavobacterium sp. WG47]